MNSFKSTTELKAESRELLLGKYHNFIFLMLLIEIITSIPYMLASSFSSRTIISTIICIFIFFLIELLASILKTGYNFYNLNIGLNREAQIHNLFYGFVFKTNHIILSQLILFVIDLICILPSIILSLLFYYISGQASFITPVITAILFVIGVYFAIYFNLKYQFIFYILLDYPDASIKDIFEFSAVLMKGNYFRLFYLYVSLVPYYLLSLCSLGIGFLFVIPYQKMTITKFYMDLIDCYYRQKSQDKN